MKNLKRLLAVLVVAVMMLTAMIPTSAASFSYSAEAQKLYTLGLYKGVSPDSYEPDLGSMLTREQGVVMLLRLLGLEADALALTDSDVNLMLSIFSDKNDIASWAKKQVAYGIMYKMINGFPDGTFKPQGQLIGKDYCKMLLAALGYTVDSAIYNNSAIYLAQNSAAKYGMTYSLADKVTNKAMTRDDLVGVSYYSLNAFYKKGGSVIDKLVDKGVVTEALALGAGAYSYDANVNATAKVAAYEAVSYATLDEIAATATALTAAQDEVAKLVVDADKAALQARIDAMTTKITAKKTAIESANAEELAAQTAAEAAVKAYEDATTATDADVTAAEALKVTADAKVALVGDAAAKAAFQTRVDARATVVAARKVDLANIATATAAVKAYTDAAYDTLEKVAAAEVLAKTAADKVAVIVDATAKADLSKLVAGQDALVAAKKIELSSSTVAVTADNLKTITAVFSKEMDEASIKDNITVKVDDGNTTIISSLADDKKTLTIQYTGSVSQSAEVKLTLDGLKDTKGVAFAKYENKFTMRDVTDPSVIGVSVTSPYKLRLAISEPLKYNIPDYTILDGSTELGIVKIDGNPVYASTSADANVTVFNGYINLNLASPLTAGSHSLTISGLKDVAGWASAEKTFTVNVISDTAAPVATSVENIGKTIVKLTFNENIDVSKLSSARFSYRQDGDAANVYKYVNPITDNTQAYYSKDNYVILDLSSAPLGIPSIVGFEVAYQSVSDESGNYNPVEGKLIGKAVDDRGVPSLVSFSVEKDNYIKVVFSEKVVAAESNFLFDGKADNSANSVVPYDDKNPDGMTYKVDFDDLTAAGSTDAVEKKVKIVGIKDVSVWENTMTDLEKKFYPNDNKSPVINAAVVRGSGNDYKIDLFFSEVVDAAMAKVPGNYFVCSATDNKPVSGVTNASVAVDTNGKKVTLSLPNADGIYSSVAAILKDTAGNMMSWNLATVIENPLTVDPTTPLAFNKADIDKITLVAPNKINVKAKEVFSAIDRDSFRFAITNNSIISDVNNLGLVAAVLSSDSKSVDLILSAQFAADGKSYTIGNVTYSTYGGLGIYTVGAGTKNINTIPLQIAMSDNVAVQDKIKATQLPVYVTDKSIDGATYDAANKATNEAKGSPDSVNSYINLTFDEAVKAAAAGDTTGTSIAAGLNVTIGSNTLTPFVHFTTSIVADGNGNNTIVKVTLTKEGAKKTKGQLLKDYSNFNATITNASYIVDLAGNGVNVR